MRGGRAGSGDEGGTPSYAEDGELVRRAKGLLARGQFSELSELLTDRELQDWDASGGRTQRQVRDSIRLLCRASSEVGSEAAWHEEALSRIHDRALELQRTLTSAIELVGQMSAGFLAEVAPVPQASREPELASPRSLTVYGLGQFRAFLGGRALEAWSNGKGKAIFKSLLTSRNRWAGKEVLMERFWPEAQPDAARNSLNVAIYALRQVFRPLSRSSILLYQDDGYLLNPAIDIWIDFEAFTQHLDVARQADARGDLSVAMHEYRCAEALYQGELFQEDRYEDWLDPLRLDLRDRHLALLHRLADSAFDHQDYSGCVELCKKMLETDPCHEVPHRRLMQCWSRQGLLHLAMRQYHVCRETLERELDVAPSPITKDLFERIRQREPV